MLLRLAYLGLTNTFAMVRLLPMSNRDKDIEILALRHQIAVLQRQLGDTRVRFSPADRALEIGAAGNRLARKLGVHAELPPADTGPAGALLWQLLYRSKSHRCTSNHVAVFIDGAPPTIGYVARDADETASTRARHHKLRPPQPDHQQVRTSAPVPRKTAPHQRPQAFIKEQNDTA